MVSGGGFKVSSEPLANFGKHLDELQSNLKSTSDLVGGMVCDPGMFGINPACQLMAAGASTWTDKARHQFDAYSKTIGEFADKVTEAAKRYQSGEEDAVNSIVRFD
nr:hypothetical protein [Amycolatopsis lexingtonensis]